MEDIKLLEVFKVIVKFMACVVFAASCFIVALNIVAALAKFTEWLWNL